MTGTLTFIGNATTLLQYGGFTLLTDPNFLHRGERAYLGKGIWSRRLIDPAMTIGELPPLDAVVLSHLHADHFDRRARDELPRARRSSPRPRRRRSCAPGGSRTSSGCSPGRRTCSAATTAAL
jgi:glyoxylase-like metal-dependent hydrolase (beta-lactamase superfamily II)